MERYSYTPYGGVSVLNADFSYDGSSDISNTYMYTGRWRDPDTHLQLNGNRWFDSQLGRWLTRDPIGYRGGVNLYRYVDSQPALRVDPFGFEPYWGRGWNPFNWRRWLYTGDPNTSDSEYNRALRDLGDGLADLSVGFSITADTYMLPLPYAGFWDFQLHFLNTQYNPYTGDLAFAPIGFSTGFGAGVGGIVDAVISFSPNDSPELVTHGVYVYIEIDTPVVDLSYQHGNDGWGNHYDKYSLGIGITPPCEVGASNGIGSAP